MTITATAPRAAAYRGKLRWWTELPLVARWNVLQQTRLAVLDDRVLQVAVRYPAVVDALITRAARRHQAALSRLPGEESVYSARTSVFFKHTHVYRIVDKQRNTLVYLAISDKIIEGSPQNAISTVPIMPWGH